MEEENRRGNTRDAEQDFLTDISRQFSGKDQEQDFLNSISPSSPKEDIQVNVGERVQYMVTGWLPAQEKRAPRPRS